MRRAALAALALLIAPAIASAQDADPPPTAKPPDPFELDRAAGPLAFDVSFEIADRHDAHLQIRFDELDPAEAGAPKGDGEREILALEFQPFEGARFSLSRSTKTQPLIGSALLQVPEPPGLVFRLRFELPQEGGLAVTLPDGMPVVIATTPRAARMHVEFAAGGGVVAFTATKAVRSTRLALGPDEEEQFSSRLRLVRRADVRRAVPPLGPKLATDLPPVPAIKEVRAVDRQEIAGGILERWVIAFEDGIESPLIVARPVPDVKRPALLCIAGGPKGDADESILRTLGAAIAQGRTVAAFELIGAGERRLILPHDALHVPELELVGLSSFDAATVEAMQVLKWMAGRADVDAEHLGVTGTNAGELVAERIAAADGKHPQEKPAAGESDLTDDAVRVGDDYLHLRFDSCQLQRARARREELGSPDRTVPLPQRMQETAPAAVPVELPMAFVNARGAQGTWWWTSNQMSPLARRVAVVASDRGMRVAIEEWAARSAPADDETCVAIDAQNLALSPPGTANGAMAGLFSALEKMRGTSAEPPRVYADGAIAIPLLAVIVQEKITITSFTASHTIPSFELLLARPHEAHRAEPELGVLTQGMPEWLFVPNALTRWEIEDAVLELIGRGVAVDWQDPVDALRRPLSRHDRLAMWPRVLHAKFAR